MTDKLELAKRKAELLAQRDAEIDQELAAAQHEADTLQQQMLAAQHEAEALRKEFGPLYLDDPAKAAALISQVQQKEIEVQMLRATKTELGKRQDALGIEKRAAEGRRAIARRNELNAYLEDGILQGFAEVRHVTAIFKGLVKAQAEAQRLRAEYPEVPSLGLLPRVGIERTLSVLETAGSGSVVLGDTQLVEHRLEIYRALATGEPLSKD